MSTKRPCLLTSLKFTLLVLCICYITWLPLYGGIRVGHLLKRQSFQAFPVHSILRVAVESLLEAIAYSVLAYSILTEQFIVSGCFTTITSLSIVFHAAQVNHNSHLEWICLSLAVVITATAALCLIFLYERIQQTKVVALDSSPEQKAVTCTSTTATEGRSSSVAT